MDGLFHLDDVIIQVTHSFLQAVVDKALGCVVHYYEVHRSVPVVRGQLDGCFLLVVDEMCIRDSASRLPKSSS